MRAELQSQSRGRMLFHVPPLLKVDFPHLTNSQVLSGLEVIVKTVTIPHGGNIGGPERKIIYIM